MVIVVRGRAARASDMRRGLACVCISVCGRREEKREGELSDARTSTQLYTHTHREREGHSGDTPRIIHPRTMVCEDEYMRVERGRDNPSPKGP